MVAKKKMCTYLNSHHTMLDNHCTRAAQLSHGGCSQQVHKIVYLPVKKGFYFGQNFTSENIHPELLSLSSFVSAQQIFCGLSDSRYST